jgi:hypothetical protein
MAHHHVPHHDVESGFGLGISMTTRRNETSDVIIFYDFFGYKFSQLGNNFFFKFQIFDKIYFLDEKFFPFKLHFESEVVSC